MYSSTLIAISTFPNFFYTQKISVTIISDLFRLWTFNIRNLIVHVPRTNNLLCSLIKKTYKSISFSEKSLLNKSCVRSSK